MADNGDGGPARREQLLDAAARCFARGGFNGTTVAEISLEAECSPGLLYRYFAGKEALVAALVEREAEKTVAALSAIEGSHDLFADLGHAARSTVTGNSDPRYAALHIQIIAEASRGSAVSDPVRRHFADVTAALTRTLAAGQQAGLVAADLDPAGTARVLVALVSGLTLLRSLDPAGQPAAPDDPVFELVARMLSPTSTLTSTPTTTPTVATTTSSTVEVLQ